MQNELKSYCGRLIDGKTVRITVSGGHILSREAIPDNHDLPWMLPALVDLQHNGALGTYYNYLGETGVGAIRQITQELRRHGVGRCLLTTTTYDHEKLIKTLADIDSFLSYDTDAASMYFGIFHEGIFISPEDGWRGAHDPNWIRDPDMELFRRLDEASGKRIRMVNVAPERPGALKFMEELANTGKKVALGHCNPDAGTITEAVERGASIVTHFGNGAAPMIHRFNNPLWGFLAEKRLALGLICDGHHLPPAIVKTAFGCRPKNMCIPISDASGYSGCAHGIMRDRDGRDISISAEGRINLAGKEIMVGAWFQLDRAVEYLVSNLGFSFTEAWRQCSLVPAELIGIKLPQLGVGEEATFVIADWNGDKLNIKGGVFNGDEVKNN